MFGAALIEIASICNPTPKAKLQDTYFKHSIFCPTCLWLTLRIEHWDPKRSDTSRTLMAAYLETMAIAVAFEETVVSKIHEDSVDVLRGAACLF